MTEGQRRSTDTTDEGIRQRRDAARPTPLATFCRTMLGHSPIPTAIVAGPDHVLLCVSPGFTRLLEAEASALEGRSLRAVLDRLQAAAMLDALDHAARTGETVAVEEALHSHPQHGLIAWKYQICPIFDAQGRPSELFLEIQDITVYLRAAQAAEDIRAINEQLIITNLREQGAAEESARQLAFVQTLTQSLNEGVYALDVAGRVSYVNPSAERMLGRTAAEMLGRPAQEAIPVRNGASAPATDGTPPFWAVLRTGVPYRDDDAQIFPRHGPPLPVTYTLAPMRSAEAIVGVVGVFHDVSEILRLHHLREEYLTLLAHDLRSPLTTILGVAGLLQRKLQRHGLPREVSQVETIIASSQRMDLLIQDILDQSALEAGRMTLALGHVDLVATLRRSIEQLPNPPDQNRIRLETGESMLVVGAVRLIERVLVNLLSNALKYSPPDQAVTVRLSHDGQQALVAVRDHGVGIDPEDQPHVFAKHHRARTAGAIPGTGLGLYSSQLIVTAHQGRMWVESTVGIGSTFFVAFPLAPTEA